MSSLEKTGALDRAAENLPTWEVLWARLEERGRSLVRPELCKLLAYAKLDLMGRLLGSDLPDDPAAYDYLRSYFPAAALEAAGEDSLDHHGLRPQIIACQLTNDLVDLMGATFVNRVSRDTGRTPSEVARAWLIAATLADHAAVVRRVSGAGNGLSPRVVYRWLLGLARVLERTTRWLLLNVEVDQETATIIERHQDGLGRLRADFAEFVAGDDRVVYERRITEIERHGAEPDLAKNLITLRFLDQLFEILRVAPGNRGEATGGRTCILPNIRACPCSVAAAGGLRFGGGGPVGATGRAGPGRGSEPCSLQPDTAGTGVIR